MTPSASQKADRSVSSGNAKRKESLDEKIEFLRQQRIEYKTISDLERKVENFEHQKETKQKENEELSKKIQQLEDQKAKDNILIEVMKKEKSKRNAESEWIEKMKNENGDLKSQVNRLEGIVATDKETKRKLVSDIAELQKQNKLQMEELSELRIKTGSTKFEKSGYCSLAEDRQLLAKKMEFLSLKKNLTDPHNQSEKETLIDSYLTCPEVRRNAANRARKLFEEHCKAVSHTIKAIETNLTWINQHFEFTVEGLYPIPNIPGPFTEEMQVWLQNKK